MFRLPIKIPLTPQLQLMDTEVNSSPLEKGTALHSSFSKDAFAKAKFSQNRATLTNLNEAGMIRQGRIFILTRSLFLNSAEVCVGRLNYSKKHSSRIDLLEERILGLSTKK